MTDPPAELISVPLEQVVPGLNVRGRVGDVDELALSMRVLGLQKPILVVRADGDRFTVLDGHRRLAAAQKACLPTIDVIVRSDAGEALRIQQQLAMGAHAKAFDPMAEARGLHRLMFEHKLTREQISRAVGKTPAWVRDRVSLVHLKPAEQEAVAAGRMPLGEALGILRHRRAERDGTAAHAGTVARPRMATGDPTPVPAGTPGFTGRADYRVPHFTRLHPLADAAAARCRAIADHVRRATLSGTACGECWEAQIRTDAITHLEGAPTA